MTSGRMPCRGGIELQQHQIDAPPARGICDWPMPSRITLPPPKLDHFALGGEITLYLDHEIGVAQSNLSPVVGPYIATQAVREISGGIAGSGQGLVLGMGIAGPRRPRRLALAVVLARTGFIAARATPAGDLP